jgi:hypothetical protein
VDGDGIGTSGFGFREHENLLLLKADLPIRLEQNQPDSRRGRDRAADEQPFGIIAGRTSDEFGDLGFEGILGPESVNERDDTASEQRDADDAFHVWGDLLIQKYSVVWENIPSSFHLFWLDCKDGPEHVKYP